MAKTLRAPMLNLSTEEKRELGEVLDRYDDAKQYFVTNYFKRFDKLQRLKYKFLEGDKRYADEERHRLNIPIAFSNIETIKPLLLGQNPTLGVSMRGEDDALFSEANAKLFEYQWDTGRAPIKLATGLEYNMVYGTCVFFIPWVRKFRKVKTVSQVSVPIKIGPLSTEIPVYAREKEVKLKLFEGPNLMPVSPFRFFPDRWATDINGDSPAMYLCHEEWVSHEEVMSRIKSGTWDVDKNTAAIIEESTGYSDERMLDEEARSGRALEMRMGQGGVVRDRMHVAVHYWTTEDDAVMYKVVLDRKFIVRKGDSPFPHGQYPYVKITDYEVPNEFYGIGECEIIEHMQYLFNDIYNIRVDSAISNMVPMWISERNNFDDTVDHFTFSPGKIYEATNPDRLKEFPKSDVSSLGFNEEEALHRLFSLVSGVSALLKLPESAPVQRSATGAEVVQRISNLRMQMKLRNLDYQGVREIAYQWFMLNNHFLTQRDVARVVGPNLAPAWYNLPFEDGREVPFDLKLQLSSESPLNKDAIRQELLTFVGVAGQNPYFQQIFTAAGAWEILAEKVTEAFGQAEVANNIKAFRQQGGMQAMMAQQQAQGLPPEMGGQPALPAGAPPEGVPPEAA